MTPLAHLAEILRARTSTLPWALAHVGIDGGEAALLRAWWREPCLWPLFLVSTRAPPLPMRAHATVAYMRARTRCPLGCGDKEEARHVACPACCAAFRSVIACPRWEDMAAL